MIKEKKQIIYFEVLRVISAFFVIVNHTNSDIFLNEEIGSLTWFLSLTWFALCKFAVPVFIMISGACLLGKVDSYKKNAIRIVRLLIVIIAFSYVYFLYDAVVDYGLWPRMIDFSTFFETIINKPILISYWYLYLYMGILIFLPVMQRFVQQATKKDLCYAIAMCFILIPLWSFVVHYFPNLKVSPFFLITIPSPYIGLFLLGYLLATLRIPSKKRGCLFAILFVLFITIFIVLTWLDAKKTNYHSSYLFLDTYASPSIIVCITSAIVFWGVRLWLDTSSNLPKGIELLAGLGKYTFGIYLVHELILMKTKAYLYTPLLAYLPSMVAVIIWEIAIFVLGLGVTWVLHKIPLIKKLV